MPIQNLRGTQGFIQAARLSGQPDNVIAQRMIASGTFDPQAKKVFVEAKSRGIDDTKILNQFVDLPSGVDGDAVEREVTESLKSFGTFGKITNFLSDFLGPKKLGIRLAAEISKFSPEHRENIREAEKQLGKEEARKIATGGVSTREAIGSAVETGVSVALPLLKGAKTALGAAKQFGGLTGVGAFGRGLEEGRPVGESAERAILPAFTGVVLGAGFHFGGRVINSLVKDAPERLYQSALKQSTMDLKREISERAPNLSRQLIEKGVFGGEDKILTQSITALNQLEKKITNEVSKSTGSILTRDIMSSLDGIIRRYTNVLGKSGSSAAQAIKKIIKGKGKSINIKEALKLKRDIYETLSNSAFNVDASLSQKAEALRVVATRLMKEIGRISPKVGELTKQQQMWIRTAQALEGQMARSGRANIVGLTDAILAAGGGANPTVLLAGVGRKLLETTGAKTTAAVALDRFGKLIEKLPVDQAGKVSKEALVNLVKQLNI